MTKEQGEKLKASIRKLVRAEIANSWKGGGYPADIPIIEEELRVARMRVSALITKQVVKS